MVTTELKSEDMTVDIDTLVRIFARKVFAAVKVDMASEWNDVVMRPLPSHPDALVECVTDDDVITWSDAEDAIRRDMQAELLQLTCGRYGLDPHEQHALNELIGAELHMMHVAGMWPCRDVQQQSQQ